MSTCFAPVSALITIRALDDRCDRIAIVTSTVALGEQRQPPDNPGSGLGETRRDFWRKRPRIAADRCGRVMAVGEGETRRGRATVAKPLRTRA